MIAQYVYTETDAPGPYKKEGGFKYKCVNLPFFEDSPLDRQTRINNLRPLLEVGSGEFFAYRAVDFDPFISADKFAELPKDYIYLETVAKRFIFGRLATSGTNHGRPRTPFHQGIVLEQSDLNTLMSEFNANSGGIRPRPIDMAFWSGWANPRGEVEVNAIELDEGDFCIPNQDAMELSATQNDAYIKNPQLIRDCLNRFASAIYHNQNILLPPSAKEDFPQIMSIATHMVPQGLGWLLGFTTLGAPKLPKNFEPSAPAVGISEKETDFVANHFVQLWTDVILYAYDNGFDISLAQSVDRLASMFRFQQGGTEPDKKLQSVLTLPLLAFVLTDADFADNDDLVNRCVAGIGGLGLPSGFRSNDAQKEFINWIQSAEIALNNAHGRGATVDQLSNLAVLA